MDTSDIAFKAYTLHVAERDIVVLHLEYDMQPETIQPFLDAFTKMLRSRSLDNMVLVLQPGQMLSTQQCPQCHTFLKE